MSATAGLATPEAAQSSTLSSFVMPSSHLLRELQEPLQVADFEDNNVSYSYPPFAFLVENHLQEQLSLGVRPHLVGIGKILAGGS